MTQDYAKRPSPRKAPAKKKATRASGAVPNPPKKAAPQYHPGRIRIVLSLLLLLGMFIGGLYMLQSVPPTQQETLAVPTPSDAPTSTKPKVVEKPKNTQQKATEVASEKDPRFRFYEILPNTEVETKDIDAYKFKEKTTPKGVYYMIQTGSFRSPEDAERHKATIAFQGIKAKVEVVQNAQGQTWHRVTTGPYMDRSQMNSALDKLVALNIQPLVKTFELPKTN